jgi:hypothetical protein
MKDLEHLYKQSIKNRRDFLEKKKIAWVDCNSERQKKDIIVKLIQLEPSHLAEDWILDQVIKWLKDRKNNLQYLEAAFMKKGKRNEIQNSNNMAEVFFLFNKIEKVKKRKNCKRREAIKVYLLTEDEKQLIPNEIKTLLNEVATGVNLAPLKATRFAYEKLEKITNALEQRLKRFRRYLDKRLVPYPYYGLDFLLINMGTENERLEVHISKKPITSADGKIALFGDTKMSFPRIKKSNQ